MTETPDPARGETPTESWSRSDASATEDTAPFMGWSPVVSPASGPTQRRRGRAAFAGSVVAASLLVGAGAGVGGAAAWIAFQDNGSTLGSTATRTTSPVVDTSPAPAADGSVEKVAQAVLPSVVKIDVVGSQEAGSGSGIILSSDGEILTNNHVVEVAGNGGSITVSFNDGSTAKATIVGTDPVTDTAVIKAQGVSGLTPATIGRSGELAVGQPVVAVGSPYGLDATVTSGIVSALDRPVDVGAVQGESSQSGQAQTSVVYPAIQTDAAINPGNSGGPLVDTAGHVVGINASIQTASSGSSSPFGDGSAQSGSIGLGFAIPIDEVWPVVQQMRDGQTPTHAIIGIAVSTQSAADSKGLLTTGAKIESVTAGGAGQQAGLKPGDVITKLDDQVITDSDGLVATVRAERPGDRVTITYVRGGQTRTTDVTLGSDEQTTSS